MTRTLKSFWAMLLVFLAASPLLITGCGHTPSSTSTPVSTSTFSGTRLSNYQDGSEKLILNTDGSYKQFIQTKTHRSLTNISRWTPGQPPPNSSDTGQWFILHDYVAPWDWVKSKPNAPIKRSTMLISTEGFNGFTRPLPSVEASTDSNSGTTAGSVSPQRHKMSQSTYDMVILLGIIFTFIWIYAIVGAAQRGDTIWLIIIVLFGVCPAFIYALTSMMGSRRRY